MNHDELSEGIISYPPLFLLVCLYLAFFYNIPKCRIRLLPKKKPVYGMINKIMVRTVTIVNGVRLPLYSHPSSTLHGLSKFIPNNCPIILLAVAPTFTIF